MAMEILYLYEGSKTEKGRSSGHQSRSSVTDVRIVLSTKKAHQSYGEFFYAYDGRKCYNVLMLEYSFNRLVLNT